MVGKKPPPSTPIETPPEPPSGGDGGSPPAGSAPRKPARRSRAGWSMGWWSADRWLGVIAIVLGVYALVVALRTDSRVEYGVEPQIRQMIETIPIDIPVYLVVTLTPGPDINQDLSWWGLGLLSGATTFDNHYNAQRVVHTGREYRITFLPRPLSEDLEKDAGVLAAEFSARYPKAPVGFVIGPVSSGQAKRLKEARPFAGKPLILLMPIPTSTDVRDGDLHMYQMSADNDMQLRRALSALGSERSPLVIIDDGEFNREFWENLEHLARELQMAKPLVRYKVSEFMAVLPTLRAADFSGIFYAGMFDKTRVAFSLLQAREDWRSMPIILADGCARVMREGLGIDVTLENLYLLFQSEACDGKEGGGPDVRLVLREAAQGCPITAAPLGYDAMSIIRKSLSGQNGDVTFDGVVQWLTRETVSGMAQQYRFDRSGRNGAGKWFLFRVRTGGVFESVEGISR